MAYETCGLATGLEDLVQVARHQQITTAADLLGVPQPTLSRSIARLSAAVGSPLTEKSGRGIRVTRHGRLLAAHAECALADVIAGIRAIHAETDPDSGTVILGFLNSMGPTLIPLLLHGFKAIKPRVVVQLVQRGSDELLGQVVDGNLDMCIAAPRHDLVPGELEVRPLAVEPLVLLVPEHHRLAQNDRIEVDDMVTELLITMHPGYGLRDLTDDLLDATQHRPRYVFESHDIPTAIGLVRAGLGVAVLPAGNEGHGTVAVPIASPKASRTIALIWSRDRELPPPAAELRSHIATTAPTLLLAGKKRRNATDQRHAHERYSS